MRHKLVQREAELEAIERLLNAAVHGSGGALVLEGTTGIGKTSLLDAAVSRAGTEGLDTRAARADDFERRLPFAVAHQLFEPLLRSIGDAERSNLLSGAPRQTAVLGLYALVVRVAEHGPLLLVIDDAQHADEASLEWVRFMLPRLAALPIALLLSAHRPDGAPDGAALEFLDEGGVETLALAPLGEIAARSLLRAEIGAAPDPLFARTCRTVTAGNPLLLRELARSVVAQRMAPTRENASAVAELSSPHLNRLVAARLRRLPAAQRALTEALAVLGPEATLLDAGNLACLESADAAAAADRLRESELLATDVQPCFAQPMVGRAVRALLPAGERSARHLRAAAVLERHGAPPERVAAQLLESEPGALDWVSRGLRVAAEAALGRGEPRGAVRLLRRALAETAPGERAAVLRELGVAESRLPDGSAVEHLREAFARATTACDRAAVALALAQTLVAAGRVAESIEVLDAATLETHALDEDLVLRFEAELCAVSRFHPPRARRTAARLEELAATGSIDPPARRAMLACLAAETVLTGGRVAEAAVLAERALAGGRLVRELTCESPVLHLACLALIWCDRPGASLVQLDEALQDARARGSAVGFQLVGACRAHAHLRAGDVVEAEAEARSVLDEGSSGAAPAVALAVSALALSLLEGGQLSEAEDALAAAPSRAAPPALGASATLLFVRGRLRLERGDAGGALDDLEAAGAALEQCGVTSPALLPWRSTAALAAIAQGERDRAGELVREELVLARRCGAPRAVAVALRVCARLSSPTEAIALLTDADSVLEDTEARLEHAHCLCELGAALRRARRRRDAREPLRRALELARGLGAGVLTAQARGELALAGARPRRDAYSGRDALTPAEKRIAELAAGAMGNREIAAALCLSTKTVETHLSRSYAKLGIGSRRELRSALARSGKIRAAP